MNRPAVLSKSWLLLVLATAISMSCTQSPPPIAPTTPKPTPAAAMMGPPGTQPAVVGKPYPGTGVVTLINLKEGWVELNHDDIPGLMPPMQMEWTVEPQTLMKGIRVGDKVNFIVVETGKGEIITDIKRAPAAK